MSFDAADWAERTRGLLVSARAGDEAALGQLLELYRHYLLAIASEEMASGLRPRLSASDVVQDAMLEAFCLFDRFQGEMGGELRAWLRAILLNKLNDVHDHHWAQKRRVDREQSLDDSGGLGPLREALPGDASTPSGRAARNEEFEQLAEALARLPDHERQVILWRNSEQLSFAEIGRRLGRSEDAARMLFGRVLERLQELMERS